MLRAQTNALTFCGHVLQFRFHPLLAALSPHDIMIHYAINYLRTKEQDSALKCLGWPWKISKSVNKWSSFGINWTQKDSYETTRHGAAGDWWDGMNVKVILNSAFLLIEAQTNPEVSSQNSCQPGMGIRLEDIVTRLHTQLNGKHFQKAQVWWDWWGMGWTGCRSL